MKYYWDWKHFFRIFQFFEEKSNFSVQNVFHRFRPSRPICVLNIRPYIEKSIFYRFFLENIANFSGPPYFGGPDLGPLWAGPVSKKLQRVRKTFIGIHRKFEVDTPNDKKSYPRKGLGRGGVRFTGTNRVNGLVILYML